ncbi:MAG: hypothetical protein FWC29_01505 [Methanomassiliicoccaceae archaeon]|nr:hypothetical protein [Methanomassiliicoccaceae archaeon]
MNAKLILLISVLILFSGLPIAAFSDVSDGAEPAVITDGTGRTFVYNEPTEHIVTMGYASTLTVAMLGEIDKIIAVDTYSTYEYTKDERLKDLDAVNLGSIYAASNNDKIVTQFAQWVQAGKMSLDDTIILTAYSNANVLRNLLMNEVGFTHVLIYLSITTYEQIVDFVRSMSIIVTGEVSRIVDDMNLVKETIDDRLEGITEKAKGLGVWYTASSGEFSVGNRGSITVSLIEAAGGINVAYNSSVSSSTYGDKSKIIQLVEANPDVVIFLSASYSKSVGDFRNEVLGGNSSVKILLIDKNWNNYDPDAAEGLWAFACAMYPDLFEGPAPHTEESSGSNLLMFAAAGTALAVVILIAAYFLMRRP